MAQGLDHCLVLSGTLCPHVHHYSQGPTKGKTEKGWTEIYLRFYISLSQNTTQSWNSTTRTTPGVPHTAYIYATQHRSCNTASSAGHTWGRVSLSVLSLQQPRVGCATLSSPKSGAANRGSGSRHHRSRKSHILTLRNHLCFPMTCSSKKQTTSLLLTTLSPTTNTNKYKNTSPIFINNDISLKMNIN